MMVSLAFSSSSSSVRINQLCRDAEEGKRKEKKSQGGTVKGKAKADG
jgi:hypothetical protein